MMKITEIPAWANQHRQQQPNQQDNTDFALWLNNEKPLSNGAEHLNPIAPNAGDEYYWQHQHQLQQSELQFKAKPLPDTQHNLLPKRNTSANVPQTHSVTQQDDSPSALDASPQNKATIVSYQHKFIPLITQLHHALERSSLISLTENMALKTDQYTEGKELKKSNENANYSAQFKNSHFFIDGEQIELTLNLHEYTQQEQNELIHLIQTYLKKKGLVLNQLIINGVAHD